MNIYYLATVRPDAKHSKVVLRGSFLTEESARESVLENTVWLEEYYYHYILIEERQLEMLDSITTKEIWFKINRNGEEISVEELDEKPQSFKLTYNLIG